MYFRLKGTKIQCLRAEYDSAKKRSVNRMVASLDRWRSSVPDELRDLLTDDERGQLQEFLDKRRAESLDSSKKAAVRGVAREIKSAADAMSEGYAEGMTDDDAAAIYKAVKELRKQLKKAGFAESRLTPKLAKSATKLANENQQDLL